MRDSLLWCTTGGLVAAGRGLNVLHYTGVRRGRLAAGGPGWPLDHLNGLRPGGLRFDGIKVVDTLATASSRQPSRTEDKTMNPTLLDQFVREECTAYVRGLLLGAVDAARAGHAPTRQRFEFNRFEVTIDKDEDIIALEDMLEPGAFGAQMLPLAEALDALDEEVRRPNLDQTTWIKAGSPGAD